MKRGMEIPKGAKTKHAHIVVTRISQIPLGIKLMTETDILL